MSHRLRIGSNLLEVGEASLQSFTQQGVQGPSGLVERIRKTLTIQGTILPGESSTTDAEREADIQTRMSQIEGYALVPGGITSGVGFEDSQSRPTGAYLSTTNRIGAIQVTGFPSYSGEFSQLLSHVNFTMAFSADYSLSSPGAFVDFTESYTQRGTGGALHRITPTNTGTPDIQIVHQQTPVFGTQQGQAIVYGSAPTAANPPMFPSRIIPPATQISIRPAAKSSGLTSAMITTWTYQFQDVTSFSGTPTVI